MTQIIVYAKLNKKKYIINVENSYIASYFCCNLWYFPIKMFGERKSKQERKVRLFI